MPNNVRWMTCVYFFLQVNCHKHLICLLTQFDTQKVKFIFASEIQCYCYHTDTVQLPLRSLRTLEEAHSDITEIWQCVQHALLLVWMSSIDGNHNGIKYMLFYYGHCTVLEQWRPVCCMSCKRQWQSSRYYKETQQPLPLTTLKCCSTKDTFILLHMQKTGKGSVGRKIYTTNSTFCWLWQQRIYQWVIKYILSTWNKSWFSTEV